MSETAIRQTIEEEIKKYQQDSQSVIEYMDSMRTLSAWLQKRDT